jgi:hypothetical protein
MVKLILTENIKHNVKKQNINYKKMWPDMWAFTVRFQYRKYTTKEITKRNAIST